MNGSLIQRFPAFDIMAGVSIIFHSLVSISLKKRVNLWSWPGAKMVIPVFRIYIRARKNAAERAFVLQTAHLDSIPVTAYGFLSPSGMIPKHRTWIKP